MSATPTPNDLQRASDEGVRRMLHSWMTLAETSATCEHPIDLYQVLDRRIVEGLEQLGIGVSWESA